MPRAPERGQTPPAAAQCVPRLALGLCRVARSMSATKRTDTTPPRRTGLPTKLVFYARVGALARAILRALASCGVAKLRVTRKLPPLPPGVTRLLGLPARSP